MAQDKEPLILSSKNVAKARTVPTKQTDWDAEFPELARATWHPPAPYYLSFFDKVMVQILPGSDFTKKGVISGCLPNDLYHVKVQNHTYNKHRGQLMPITRNQHA